MSGADKACSSLGNTSHGTDVADKSLLDSCLGVRSVVDLDRVVVYEDRSSIEIGEIHFLSKSTSDIAASYDIQSVGHPACDLAINNADNCSEMESLNVPDFSGLGDSHEPEIHVQGVDVCSQASGQSAIPGGCGTFSSSRKSSCDTCVAEKPQCDSCVGIGGQTILEGDTKLADISSENPVTQLHSQFASAISANYAEAKHSQ